MQLSSIVMGIGLCSISGVFATPTNSTTTSNNAELSTDSRLSAGTEGSTDTELWADAEIPDDAEVSDDTELSADTELSINAQLSMPQGQPTYDPTWKKHFQFDIFGFSWKCNKVRAKTGRRHTEEILVCAYEFRLNVTRLGAPKWIPLLEHETFCYSIIDDQDYVDCQVLDDGKPLKRLDLDGFVKDLTIKSPHREAEQKKFRIGAFRYAPINEFRFQLGIKNVTTPDNQTKEFGYQGGTGPIRFNAEDGYSRIALDDEFQVSLVQVGKPCWKRFNVWKMFSGRGDRRSLNANLGVVGGINQIVKMKRYEKKLAACRKWIGR